MSKAKSRLSSASETVRAESDANGDSKPKAPYVFLSHDTRDAEIAEAFSKLLSSVTAGVLKCFRSSDKKGVQGIEYGVEWFPELMKKLQEASDVVCLLTENSLNRPWILFEAGVAKGKLDTPILGLAIGIPLATANTGPFAQFQNSDDEEDSLVKLAVQLVRKIPGAEPDEGVVRTQVQTFKAKVSEILKKKPEKVKEPKKDAEDTTSVAKLFEEIKVMFNDLPSRLEGPSINRRRRRRLPAELTEEMLYRARRGGPTVPFMALLAMIRDDLPFLYELGRELLELRRTGSEEEAREAIHAFHEMVEMSHRHPMMRDAIGDRGEGLEMTIMHLHKLADEMMLHGRKRRLK